MKGAMLNVNPDAILVDLAHEVRAATFAAAPSR